MAFDGNFMCTSFKQELLLAVHDFHYSGGDTFKIALYTNSATLNADTTAYSSSNECSGTNYTAGGGSLALTSATYPNTSGTTAFVTFDNETWGSSTISNARGALIYNSTPSANDKGGSSLTNPAVCVLDFGSDKSSSSGDFTVTFPTADASNAIIRIA
tara:strand:- start:19 stop:492 length:474 start_codon:yes stop_codon:yes gene_type:complete